MNALMKLVVGGALIAGATGCSGFLTGGELSNNPNTATSATPANLLVGIQSNLWAELGSDMSRTTMIWAQHLNGNLQQYAAADQYTNSEQTTNGFHQALYIAGGLGDVRKMQTGALAVGDSLFFGIGKVLEAWYMGQGADLWGDLVYSQALGPANPPLDPQLEVYAHVIAVLDSAITFMGATGPTNVGPGSADLVYGGGAAQWIALANTLKARYYMHQTNAPGVTVATLAANAIAAASEGIGTAAGLSDYAAVFSGNSQEQNLWWQFDVPAGRKGYYVPGTFLIDLMTTRGDPRLSDYFDLGAGTLGPTRYSPTAPIVFASGLENSLLLAEAQFRAGQPLVARATLVAAITAAGAGAPAIALAGAATGQEILNQILIEKYIADFQLGTEAYTDYRRTCTPNIPPRKPGGKVPGRLFYDSGERNTDTSIPQPGTAPNGFFNTATPARATSEGTGAACLAYAP